MKKIVFALTLLILFTGCGKRDDKNVTPAEAYYTSLGTTVSVYDENEKQVGFLAIAGTNQCGSTCIDDLLFVSNDSKPIVKKLDNFSADMFGFDLYEKDKNIYFSTYIDANEGHLNCHRLKIQKIKYIKSKFVVVNESSTTEKYNFDIQYPQDECGLFPGLKAIIEQQLQTELYKVVSVTDGDTIKVDLNGKTETLRLIGIDTPETVDPRKVVQCFGIEASNKAKEMLTDKNVRLEADSTQGERDKYGRLLRYVFLEDGTFYNKYMIEAGYANEYTYQSNPYKYQTDFQEAEKNAREQSKGLWSNDTCSGDTTKPADPEEAVIGKVETAEPQVKKSTSGICHEKGISPYYINTKNYTPYNTIKDCLDGGGRLSKTY